LHFRRWDEGWILAQILLDICVVEELIESIGIMVGANSVGSTAACKEQQNMNNGYLDSGLIFCPLPFPLPSISFLLLNAKRLYPSHNLLFSLITTFVKFPFAINLPSHVTSPSQNTTVLPLLTTRPSTS
jgi:hypothetical protein